MWLELALLEIGLDVDRPGSVNDFLTELQIMQFYVFDMKKKIIVRNLFVQKKLCLCRSFLFRKPFIYGMGTNLIEKDLIRLAEPLLINKALAVTRIEVLEHRRSRKYYIRCQ